MKKHAANQRKNPGEKKRRKEKLQIIGCPKQDAGIDQNQPVPISYASLKDPSQNEKRHSDRRAPKNTVNSDRTTE